MRTARAAHGVAFHDKRTDRRVPTEDDAACLRKPGERGREALRVAGFVARRVDAAGEPIAALRERGLDRHAFGDGLRDAIAAEFPHRRGRGDAALERLFVGVELQDPALEVIVFDSGLRAQRLAGTHASRARD